MNSYFYDTTARPLIPLAPVYKFDEQSTLDTTFVTYGDGFSAITSPLLTYVKDITINKKSLLMLSRSVKLSEILDIDSRALTIDTLELKTALRVENGPYVRVKSDTLELFADINKMSANTFFRFVVWRIPDPVTGIVGPVLTIWYGRKVLTIDRRFPYNVSFQPLSQLDNGLDQHVFDYFLTGNTIKLRSRVMIGGNPLRVFLSYDPLDSYKIKLIGDDHHNYNFTFEAPENNQQNVRTNFNGSSYWIKYFNDFVDQENNKTVEVNTTESISGVPVNFLCSSSYENSITTDDTEGEIQYNLNVLKNFQTPEYDYTDNKFYVSQYKVYGQVSVQIDPDIKDPSPSFKPLAGVVMRGFPTLVVTDPEGYYMTLVDYDFSNTIIPEAPHFLFNPSGMVVSHLSANIHQDFVGTVKSPIISGTILDADGDPLSGKNVITSSDLPTATTEISGNYSISVPWDWNGVVTVSDPVATYVPPEVFFTNVQDTIVQNFTQIANIFADSFLRADGPLGSNWAPIPDGALTIVSTVAKGTNATGTTVSGNYWIANTFTNDQFSEITVTSTPTIWTGPAVRSKADGTCYVGIYFNNGGSYQLKLYNRVGTGTYALMGTYICGILATGTKLRVTVNGNIVAFTVNGVERLSFYDTTVPTGTAPGIQIAGTADTTDDWMGGNASFQANLISTDGNGVEKYSQISKNNSGSAGAGVVHKMRIKRPTSPALGVAHNFLYILPVSLENDFTYGDGFEYIRGLNAHNNYNVTLIEPSFQIDPWYGDHPTNPDIKYESFFVSELRQWVIDNLSTTGMEQHWVIGFSKSGFGPMSIWFRNPTLWDVGAFWDFPAQGFTAMGQFGNDSLNYGTDANFQAKYRMTDAFLTAYRAPFQAKKRLWISGYNAFQVDVANFDAKLTSLGIQHDYFTPANVAHSWTSGWVPNALAGLYQNSLL